MPEIEIRPYAELPSCEPNTTWTIKSITHDIGKLSYEDFFNKYMRTNTPCIIKNVSTDWECSKKWICDGKIDYAYMKSEYGTLDAPVADCDTSSFNAHVKQNMKVSDYMRYLETEPRTRVLYLKDWHLRKTHPQREFYSVPSLFASDWLNEFALDKQEDDFMFVYMGPKNSWTPLHSDVYNSFSWSVNVMGRKKWILFPPGEEIKLDHILKNSPLLFEPESLENVKYYEIIQEKGDALFVPSSWYHQVVNLEDTISINHNWVNGCNIEAAWHALTRVLVTVENEISDLRNIPEFPAMCQNMLNCLHGMNFESFVKFITFIGEKRLSQLQGSSRNIYNNFTLGTNHIRYDLKSILNVVHLIEAHPSYLKQEFNVVDNFYTLKDFLKDYY